MNNKIEVSQIILELKKILNSIPSNRIINDTDIAIRDLLIRIEKLEK